VKTVLLGLVFDLERAAVEWELLSVGRSFSESRQISVLRRLMILRFILRSSSGFDSSIKFLNVQTEQ